MELKTTDIDILEKALLGYLEKFSDFNKEFKPFLKDEFYKHWEETRRLHSKVCTLLGEIEEDMVYKKSHPKVNQALNKAIVIQWVEK